MLMMAVVDFSTSGDDWVTMLLIAAFAISSSIAAGLLLRPQFARLNAQETSENALALKSVDDAQSVAGPRLRRELDENDKAGIYVPFWLVTMQGEFDEVVAECQHTLDQLATAVNDGDIERALSCHTDSARKSLSLAALESSFPLRHDLEMSLGATELIDGSSLRATVSMRYEGNPVPNEQFTFIYDESDHRWKVGHVLPL